MLSGERTKAHWASCSHSNQVELSNEDLKCVLTILFIGYKFNSLGYLLFYLNLV